MPSATVEDYIKKVYVLADRSGSPTVPMGQVASELGVAPGTTTTMMKGLAETGLVEYEPRVGVSLTPRGHDLALRILRRHRLVETFLVQVLHLDWSTVHEEAERLEHVISDRVLEAIDQQLGCPRVDPHGDPIPRADGSLAQRSLVLLSECAPGTRCRVARVIDQAEVFLNWVWDAGLRPGNVLEVMGVHEPADSMEVRLVPAHTPLGLGRRAAAKIEVECL